MNIIRILALILILTPLCSMTNADTPKPTIIYVFDPLCGWCYGFSPVMVQLHKKYTESHTFQVVSGGMITGDRIAPISTMADFIRKAYKQVEQRSGVKFGKRYINETLNGNTMLSSVPPSIALTVFASHKPNQTIEFAHALQTAIYSEGIDPTNTREYGKIAAAFGLDSASFVTEMGSPAMLQRTEAGFAQSEQLGVQGFPAVFYRAASGKLTMIANGYTTFAQLESRMKSAMKE
ncbi:MAG: DsbA family protein [Candidatus Kapabacteria bacterium]|nr:DsbA family protein [Candidatus Kapabacteria bacterium]